MRYVFVVICLIWAACAGAQTWEDRQAFGPETARERLRVLSSTDTALFAPFLEAFVAARPGVAVDYFVAATAQIDDIFRAAPEGYDVVISSAMDLQFRLANDGYARVLDALSVPGWAHWRRSVFAFTSEPAAIVVNRAAFPDGSAPRTRQALIRVLRERAEEFRGRVGTYDVRESALGYLFATQDARTSETFWRLMEVMGNLDTRLYCCSADMIRDVASGRIAVAYNVLGSYARARADLAGQIEVILPEDFQTIMMRTALVSVASPRPALAASFMAFLLDRTARPAGEGRPVLPLLDLARPPAALSTIVLEPALLTYLDALKTRQFLTEWEDAVIQ